MSRYKLVIEYNGAPYCGWQRQSNGHTVQAALEQAVFGFSGEKVTIGGAGRTDTGVHALGQVAHLDLEKEWPENKVQSALNAKLIEASEQVVVLGVTQMSDDWDSRFSAIRRYYQYRIINRYPPLTIDRGFAWHCNRLLDVEAMHNAAQILVGHHDFSTFRHANCQAKSPIKTLEKLTVKQEYKDKVIIETCSKSFLHSQVRSMVGCLRLVGENKWSNEDLKRVLEAKDRTQCAPVAPAGGLYLTEVEY